MGNLATAFNFLVPLAWEGREERIAFARQHGLGLEIVAFVGGAALNDPMHRDPMEAQLETELASFHGTKTLHGAFLDLALHSPDSRIAAISQSRIERDLLTALRLGCEKVVFHLGFNPLISVSRYRHELLHAHRDFWAYALATYPGIQICLENQWEPDWSIFVELFESVAHPNFGLCLDVAHAHVHSHFGPEAWIRGLATAVFHMHWNDNHGDRDRHLPLGAGNVDWPAIVQACTARRTMTVTLEMNHLDAIRSSLAFAGRLLATASPDSPDRPKASALVPR